MKLKDRCYTSIDDLPIKRWFEISVTGDLTRVMKEPKEVDDKIKLKLYKMYMDMRQEHMDRFGLSERYRDEFDLKEEIFNLQVKYFKTKQRHLITHINMKLAALNELISSYSGEFEIYTFTAQLTKRYNTLINPDQLTTAMFFGLVKGI